MSKYIFSNSKQQQQQQQQIQAKKKKEKKNKNAKKAKDFKKENRISPEKSIKKYICGRPVEDLRFFSSG